MDDTRQDYHASDEVITVIVHLADRLRQAPQPEFTQTSTILEIIEETARSERSRCLDAWIRATVLASPEPQSDDDSLPF